MGDVDELKKWFDDAEKQMEESGPLSSDPDALRKQLNEQKALNDEINSHKGKARDIIAVGKRLRRESSSLGEDDTALQQALEDLKQESQSVSKQSADRLGQLEQALPLAVVFQVKWQKIDVDRCHIDGDWFNNVLESFFPGL